MFFFKNEGWFGVVRIHAIGISPREVWPSEWYAVCEASLARVDGGISLQCPHFSPSLSSLPGTLQALSASNTLGHVGSDLMGEAESHKPCCACASEEKPRATDGPAYGRDFNTHNILCMRTKGNNEIDQYQFLALCCIASASILLILQWH